MLQNKKIQTQKNRPWLFKTKVDDYDIFNETLLEYIDISEYELHSTISKVDFNLNVNRRPIYHDFVTQGIYSSVVKHATSLLYDLKSMDDIIWETIWFHQYTNGSYFDWHGHSCTFAFVYYCELPYGNQLTTDFFDVWEKEVFTVDAEVGDILIYPSFFFHRSPYNQMNQRKTIFAGNYNINCGPLGTIESYRG